MKQFNNYSIRAKLTVIVMATTCVSLLLALLSMGFIDALNYRNQMKKDAVSLATMVANNSTAALSFGDAKSAREILDSLRGDAQVGSATLLDADGKPMADYRRPDWGVTYLPSVDANDVSFTWDRIEIVRPVVLEGKRIGAVAMQWDTSELYSRLWRGAFVALCILFVAAGVGYLLTMRLQRFIATPIQNLANASRMWPWRRNIPSESQSRRRMNSAN